MYAQWLRTHSLAANNFIFADSSVHHVISDLSIFVTKADGHRVLAAGDLNILRGYGEHGDAYWAARYQRPLPANWTNYVFASRGLADSLTVRALNRPEEWGPSDHCRIEIELK